MDSSEGNSSIRIGDDQPSKDAQHNVSNARQNPRYFMLDDINVDLITFVAAALSGAAMLIGKSSPLITLATFSGTIVPLRALFPRAQKPQGLTLITGASSGIGAELAYIFAKNGHDLILVARNEEQLNAVHRNCQELSQQTGTKINVSVVITDLSIPDNARKLHEEIKNSGHKVEVLVNNAAMGHGADVLEQSDDFAERLISLNCTAPVILTQLFGNDMANAGKGWILETTSMVGWVAGPGNNLYHASKHFMRAFSEAMSVELRGTGVVLTQLMPGPVKTQFVPRADMRGTFTFSSSGAVEDPKEVAKAGYDGLCKNKRMVFSSYNAAIASALMHFAPRSIHLTIGRLLNTPTRSKMAEPKRDQGDKSVPSIGS